MKKEKEKDIAGSCFVPLGRFVMPNLINTKIMIVVFGLFGVFYGLAENYDAAILMIALLIFVLNEEKSLKLIVVQRELILLLERHIKSKEV